MGLEAKEICIEAESLGDAYTKIDNSVVSDRSERVTATNMVGEVDGHSVSSSLVEASAQYEFVSRDNSKYCFNGLKSIINKHSVDNRKKLIAENQKPKDPQKPNYHYAEYMNALLPRLAVNRLGSHSLDHEPEEDVLNEFIATFTEIAEKDYYRYLNKSIPFSGVLEDSGLKDDISFTEGSPDTRNNSGGASMTDRQVPVAHLKYELSTKRIKEGIDTKFLAMIVSVVTQYGSKDIAKIYLAGRGGIATNVTFQESSYSRSPFKYTLKTRYVIEEINSENRRR